MPKELPYMKFWVKDYLADTTHLTRQEHGDYLLLLWHIWQTSNKRIPNDDQWIARKLRCTVDEVKNEVRPLISEFFKVRRGFITHKRLESEAKTAQEYSKKQEGRAKSRWNKEKDVCRGNAIHSHSHSRVSPTEYRDSISASAREGKRPGGDFSEDAKTLVASFCDLREKLWPSAMPIVNRSTQTTIATTLLQGRDLSAVWSVIEDAMRSWSDSGKSEIQSLEFFRNRVQDRSPSLANGNGAHKRLRSHDGTDVPLETWKVVAEAWKKHNQWPTKVGPRPDQPGCQCPPDLLAEAAAEARDR